VFAFITGILFAFTPEWFRAPTKMVQPETASWRATS